jgi:hypothetical protein
LAPSEKVSRLDDTGAPGPESAGTGKALGLGLSSRAVVVFSGVSWQAPSLDGMFRIRVRPRVPLDGDVQTLLRIVR